MEQELDIPEGSYVSLDGKSLRGSGLKEACIDPLHLLHAYSHELGVVIRQMECSSEKTNEIPISKKLIETLKIKNTIVTADALLCQKEIVKKIAKDNDYILALVRKSSAYGTGSKGFLSQALQPRLAASILLLIKD